MRANNTVNADSSGYSTLGRLALVAAFAIGFVTADAASAQRRCLQDPLLTGRTCSEALCVSLQATVIAICKTPAPVSCNKLSGCAVLQAEKQHWKSCALARDMINGRCWGGGNPGHQQASGAAWQQVSNCVARIALPEPIGCADPCPWIPGFTGPPADAFRAPAQTATEEETIEALIPVIQALAKQGILESLFTAENSCGPAEATAPAASGDPGSPEEGGARGR